MSSGSTANATISPRADPVPHRLPDSCSYDQAALAEPLSVLLHASRRASLAKGQSVLVFGVGAIGLLACTLAKSLGARKVVAIDINQARLAFAREEGFAELVHCLPMAERAKTTDEALQRAKDNAAAALKAFGEEDGFDVVFECTGAEPCIQMAIHVSPAAPPLPGPRADPFLFLPRQAAITGGKVMLVGMGTRNITLPLSAAALREVDIQGSFRYANTYPQALALLAGGTLSNVAKLVTHRFPLARTADAFEMLARGKDEHGRMVLKVMVDGP